jgi:hypothetical protein
MSVICVLLLIIYLAIHIHTMSILLLPVFMQQHTTALPITSCGESAEGIVPA